MRVTRSRTRLAATRDWVAPPTGVLQHIICLASTWQTPGPCLAAAVCRTWQDAAADCSGIMLLLHAGHAPADKSFAAWVAGNGRRLGALTLSNNRRQDTSGARDVLRALADAAAAARAAGQPLQLHTLRVLGVPLYTRLVGRLLAALPNLRCLQLTMISDMASIGQVGSDLVPLQQAPHLQELYLKGSFPTPDYIDCGRVGQCLPLGLKRLSLEGFDWEEDEWGLSHLTQLTFLQFKYSHWAEWFSSSMLPPGLQQLEVMGTSAVEQQLMEEQRQVVTAWRDTTSPAAEVQQQLTRLPNLTAFEGNARGLWAAAGQTAFMHQTKLSSLTLCHVAWDPLGMQDALAAAATVRSLRRLHLVLHGSGPPPTELPSVVQLTQLRLSFTGYHGSAKQLRAWGKAVGCLTGLQRLSVPAALLVAGRAWLGGLQRLRVLILDCSMYNSKDVPYVSGMSWLGALPPLLQVLGVNCETAEQAAALQLRRRLQQALGSRGCRGGGGGGFG